MFTHSCFIRANSKYLAMKLHDIGYYTYDPSGYEDAPSDWCTVTRAQDKYAGIWCNPPKGEEAYCRIDCGNNLDLFFAIAALNDEDDYMQYYTNGEDFILCDRQDWIDMYSVLCSGYYTMEMLDKFHKATVEELIEHFSTMTYKSICPRYSRTIVKMNKQSSQLNLF